MNTQVAVVTGGASGMGKVYALRMANAGVKVAVLDKGNAALEDIAAQSANIYTFNCDVADTVSVTDTIEAITAQLGPIDRLVHCAAIMPAGPLPSQLIESIHLLMAVNYGGTVNMVRAVLGDMQERKTGEIVLFGSLGGYVPVPDCGAYCATKAAVNSFAEILMEENRGSGVHIMLVCPPLVNTPLLDQAMASANPKMVADSIAKKRYSSPAAIIDAVEEGLRRKKDILFPSAAAKIMAWLRRFSPRLVWKIIHLANKS
ncbi:MAG: short-subunit dehydrogenase [Halioglobus sp.]|jgi:short-subunit dehydrogenase